MSYFDIEVRAAGKLTHWKFQPSPLDSNAPLTGGFVFLTEKLSRVCYPMIIKNYQNYEITTNLLRYYGSDIQQDSVIDYCQGVLW